MKPRFPVYDYFFSIRKLITIANSWLVFLVVCIVGYSFLSLQGSETGQQETNQTRTIQIIQELKYNFGYNYSVRSDGLDYTATYSSPLSVGYNYLITGNIISFGNTTNSNRDKNAFYKGVEGKLIIKSAIKSVNCDISCWVIQQRHSIKQQVSRYFSRDMCQSNLVQLVIPATECKDVAALAFGFILGGNTNLSKETYQSFSYFSLTHLIAVSGFQVVILMSAVEWLFTVIHLSRKQRLLASIGSVILFTWLVGFEVPVIRSGISIVLTQCVLVFLGRKLGAIRALVYSASIMCFVNPLVLFSISFQLSCLATLGIVLGKDDMITRLIPKPFHNNWYEAVRVYGVIFILILPIIAYLSGQVNPVSILINLLVLPTIPIICLLLCLGFIPVVGELFVLLAYMGIQGIVQFLTWFKTINPILDIFLLSIDMVSVVWYYSIVLTSLIAYLLLRRLGYVNTLAKITG
jgi:ComEC/Rec2-related protein